MSCNSCLKVFITMPTVPKITALTQKLLQFLYIQLFVTLIALPILLCWGLPLSLMTIIGNLIFAPFLTIFLSLSSLVFFTELLNIPNTIFTYALEKFLSVWLRIIHFGSPSWLIGFAQPSWFVIFLIPTTATIIVLHKKSTLHSRIFALSFLLATACSYLFFLCSPTSFYKKIPCHSGEILLIHHNKQTILIDPGFIAQNTNATSWIEHTLLKEMTKHLGSTTIHHLVLLQPSSRIFEATIKLCSLAQVEKVYLPTWEGLKTNNQWNNFYALQEVLEKTSGTLIKITGTMTISLDRDTYVTIKPLKKIIKTSTTRYPAIQVRGMLGDTKIMTASAKSFTKSY